MAYEKIMEDLLRESEHLFPGFYPEGQFGELAFSEASRVEEISDPMPERQPTRQTSGLSALRVEMSVELGYVPLTIEEVIDLIPGKVLSYEMKAGQKVMLRLGGAVVGEGRLVRCDGKTGIEILSLVQSDKTCGAFLSEETLSDRFR